MNRVVIHYCYPTSEMAVKLGDGQAGGFYVNVGALSISPLFKTIHGAEGFCRNNGLTWDDHPFSPAVKDAKPCEVWKTSGEGPWATKEAAIEFGEAEVGATWRPFPQLCKDTNAFKWYLEFLDESINTQGMIGVDASIEDAAGRGDGAYDLIGNWKVEEFIAELRNVLSGDWGLSNSTAQQHLSITIVKGLRQE